MEVVQIRLPKKLIKKIDELVECGYYNSRSDFIRSKLREIIDDNKYIFKNS
ncbi:MAG: CopG family transcriptional regulator [Candidatus Aenigmarchaeota archaeon ex4484_56]|nr:MAG: CopG family transcriptional regulator [Candidatus Aenigmarchaeota archaeon ex4484_56]